MISTPLIIASSEIGNDIIMIMSIDSSELIDSQIAQLYRACGILAVARSRLQHSEKRAVFLRYRLLSIVDNRSHDTLIYAGNPD